MTLQHRRKSRHFGNTLGEVETEELIHMLPDTPLEAKAERVCDSVCDVEAKILVVMPAKTPLQPKAKAFGDTMANVKAKL